MQKFLPIISIIIPTILIHNIWQTGAYLIYNLSIALGIIIITHGLLIFLLYRVFRFFKAREI